MTEHEDGEGRPGGLSSLRDGASGRVSTKGFNP